MVIDRPSATPIRDGLSWKERWEGADGGLITCWERGREVAQEDPTLAASARTGALLVLPWKGGVDGPLKSGTKVGTLYYLAMWQGLRGDDLSINTDVEVALTCSVTAVVVTFSAKAR